MKSLVSRAIVYGLVIVLGLLSALPNILSPEWANALPQWYLDNTVSLGLDLQGGSHLLLEADLDGLYLGEQQAIAEEVLTALRKERISAARPRVSEQGVDIGLRQPDQISEAVRLVRSLAGTSADGLRFSVELRDNRLWLTLTDSRKAYLSRDAVERSLEVVRRRLDETGLVEPSITRQGSEGILVQMPGVADPAEIRSLLGTTAKMTFHWAARPDASGTSGTTMVLPGAHDDHTYELERRVVMAGERIRDAHMAFNQNTGEPVVNFDLDRAGARQFADMTRNNIGRPLAIVLDDKVITAPVIRSEIGASGEISGSFTTREASELALLLRAGALPAPLEVVEERTVGPDLGSDAIAMGLTTGLLGAAMVIAFMVGLYGRWGLIACVGLTVNIGLVFGVLSLFGATLTLPGIAGIILTIGMAVDANILINERIREEARQGKPGWMALRDGFGRAYRTIMDSNFTTLIAVSLLFMLGSGPVRGFAVTIGIGLVTSLFTAIAVTRLIMEWHIRGREREPLRISGIAWLDRLSGKGVNFMRGRVVGLTVSVVLSTAAVGLFFQPGLKYGVDFTGGTVVEVQAQDLSLEHLRSTLQDEGMADAGIQEFGTEGRFLIRLPAGPEQGATTADQVDLLKNAVLTAAPEASFPKVDMVGPKVSGSFGDTTILAILLAGTGMLGYLWVRFESHFAVAAILTIALDLTKTIGFFALAGVEFNLTAVAALLALMGYSVNDKVVVFDRIRENIRAAPDQPLLELLNSSISSTLTRTVFTSVTTFLALLPMGIGGGAAVASFALPMLFGIVIGTTSSIFIASPILFYLAQRRSRKGLTQLRPTAEEMRRELELIP